MNENEFEYALNGKERQTLWGYKNPEFNESSKGVTLDAFATPEGVVPYRYSEGRTHWLKDKGSDRPCMNYVFRLFGDISRQDEQLKLVGDFTHSLPHDWEKYHVAYRSLGDEIYSKGAIRTFVYRVYENDPDRCIEHPEMLVGTPSGMYHCPVCMEMVVAGVPHPTKTQLRQFHDELLQDIRDEPFDKMVAVQEMKPRTTAPEDEPVQKVVGRDISKIVPGQFSDVPVSLENVDSLVMADAKWSATNPEQALNRTAKRRLEFRTREEQDARKCKKTGVLMRPDYVDAEFEVIHPVVSEDQKMMFDSLSDMIRVNANLVGTQWDTTMANLRNYWEMKEVWHGEDITPPAQNSTHMAGKFLLRMAMLNEDADEKIGAPLCTYDPDGIVSLFWAVHGADYVSFAFYPEQDQIVYYFRTVDGNQSSGSMLPVQESDLKKAFVLIQEFGGGKDAEY